SRNQTFTCCHRLPAYLNSSSNGFSRPKKPWNSSPCISVPFSPFGILPSTHLSHSSMIRTFSAGSFLGFFGFLGIRVSLFASSARPYQNKNPHVSDRTNGRLRDGLG